jgi:hypothetical protein
MDGGQPARYLDSTPRLTLATTVNLGINRHIGRRGSNRTDRKGDNRGTPWVSEPMRYPLSRRASASGRCLRISRPSGKAVLLLRERAEEEGDSGNLARQPPGRDQGRGRLQRDGLKAHAAAETHRARRFETTSVPPPPSGTRLQPAGPLTESCRQLAVGFLASNVASPP